MIELKNITLKEYIELEDKSEYDFAIKYANIFTNQKDEYGIGDVMELPFGLIKDFQYDLETGMSFSKLIEYVQKLTGKNNLGKEPLDKFIRFSNYITESIKQIIEVENQSLAYEPSAEEEQAGMDRFNGLGVYLQIRSLTGGDVTKYNQVREMPYSICFTELYTSKQLKDYEHDLLKLKKHG